MFKYLIILSVVAAPVSALEYTVKKNDTLWSLSQRYLKDPYLWPKITKLDGSSVGNPRRMPVGLILDIPESIANEHAKSELSIGAISEPVMLATAEVNNSESTSQKIIHPFSYYITTDAEKVVIFRNGQFISISVSALKEKGVDMSALGRNLNIDNSLLNKIFKKDI